MHTTHLPQTVMDCGNQKTPFFRMHETIHAHVNLVLNYYMSKTTSAKDSFLFYCSPAINLIWKSLLIAICAKWLISTKMLATLQPCRIAIHLCIQHLLNGPQDLSKSLYWHIWEGHPSVKQQWSWFYWDRTFYLPTGKQNLVHVKPLWGNCWWFSVPAVKIKLATMGCIWFFLCWKQNMPVFLKEISQWFLFLLGIFNNGFLYKLTMYFLLMHAYLIRTTTLTTPTF